MGLNINYMRFVRKENKEKENCTTTLKLGQIFLTKNLESRKQHMPQSKLGQKNFLSKILMNEKKKNSRHKHRCPNWGKIFLSKNLQKNFDLMINTGKNKILTGANFSGEKFERHS